MSTARDPASVPPDTVIADTRRWLERAVIGLNLCPFAKAPHAKGQIHYAVCEGDDRQALLTMLRAELQALADASPDERETTLLIAPRGFDDFLDFNDLLDEADAVVTALDLDGTLQVAPFHPRFQFAGTDVDRDGQAHLFRGGAMGVTAAAREKRDTLAARVAKATEIVEASPDDHFILWHDLEDERRVLPLLCDSGGAFKTS